MTHTRIHAVILGLFLCCLAASLLAVDLFDERYLICNIGAAVNTNNFGSAV